MTTTPVKASSSLESENVLKRQNGSAFGTPIQAPTNVAAASPSRRRHIRASHVVASGIMCERNVVHRETATVGDGVAEKERERKGDVIFQRQGSTLREVDCSGENELHYITFEIKVIAKMPN